MVKFHFYYYIYKMHLYYPALKIAFGSLYKDDVFLKPVQIVSVLAASTLFQLVGTLIVLCYNTEMLL
jgi:hypothetical protein